MLFSPASRFLNRVEQHPSCPDIVELWIPWLQWLSRWNLIIKFLETAPVYCCVHIKMQHVPLHLDLFSSPLHYAATILFFVSCFRFEMQYNQWKNNSLLSMKTQTKKLQCIKYQEMHETHCTSHKWMKKWVSVCKHWFSVPLGDLWNAVFNTFAILHLSFLNRS